MYILAHTILNLIIVLLALYSVWRFHNASQQRVRQTAPLVALGHIGLLFFISLISTLAYPVSIFGQIQLIAWTTFLHLPLLLIGYAFIFIQKRRKLAIGCVLWTLIMYTVAIDAFLIEPQWLDISYITLTSAKVSRPVRVAILADIQTDRPGDYEANALQQALAAQPDLILFAGDYIHQSYRSRTYEAESATLNAILKQAGLNAPLGVYAIKGNVDRPETWATIFAGLPIVAADRTAQIDLGPVVLTTLTMPDSFSGHVPIAAHEKFHIVLGHSPNFSLGPVNADVLIAGHTHGGQVQLPFIGPLLTLSAVPRQWAAGVTEIAPSKTLIVSRGIGLERGQAPQLRFLCRPEIIILDIVPTD